MFDIPPMQRLKVEKTFQRFRRIAMQTKVAARASQISRQIYASLPFDFRFGAMLEVFSDAYLNIRQTLGRVLYAEYIKAGVPDMPAIGDMPADQHPAKEKGAHAAQLLPRGYGGLHASKIISVARKYIRTENELIEFLLDFTANLPKYIASGRIKIAPMPLKKVENYMEQNIAWQAKDYLVHTIGRRKNKNPTFKSVTDVETGGDIDFEDPKSTQDILRRISPGDQKKMIRDLRNIDRGHPDWPEEFIFSKMEGKTLYEMAEELGVDHTTLSGWFSQYRDKIQGVFHKYWDVDVAV
jgi:hypothetical protein